MQHYAPNDDEVATGYRPRSGRTIQQYIIAEGVLKDKVVWIKGFPKQSIEKEWINFVCGYKSDSVGKGLFVLEVHSVERKIENKNIEIVSFNDYVSDYDVQLFCNFMLASKNKYTNMWKRYVSTALASLCGFDAEIAAKLLDRFDFTNYDFKDAIKELAESDEFTRRGSSVNSDHVLSLCRNGKIDEIEHRIWKAQIQILFPLIELERKDIFVTEAKNIQDVLNENNIEQYGKKITDPIDVEIGTLDYITQNYSIDISIEKRDRISFLHECRNDLAHMECCTPGKVRKLIDESPCM